jgi:hypothetical protein
MFGFEICLAGSGAMWTRERNTVPDVGTAWIFVSQSTGKKPRKREN